MNRSSRSFQLFLRLAASLVATWSVACSGDDTTPDTGDKDTTTGDISPDTADGVDIPDTADTAVDPDADIADTDIADTDIADTDIADTDIADTDIADTDIADTDIADADIADADIADADIADTDVADSDTADSDIAQDTSVDSDDGDVPTDTTTDGDAGGVVLCPPRACDDDDPCTTDLCDPETGACTHRLADGEPCDDGDDCTVDDVCLDGACEPGPPLDCSDGNACTVDVCRLSPTSEAICVSTSRSCDDGNPCTFDSCNPLTGCTSGPRVGPCDDGDRCTSGDRCEAGVCRPGAPTVCDDGQACTVDSCDPVRGCVFTPTLACRCGNGILEVTEECDDGNATAQDGCSPGCKVERCGDGVVQEALGEQCDDGNRRNNDGCTGQCKRERCGDLVVQAALGETCDDGNTAAFDGCGPTCQTEGCGDGVVQPNLGEQCDDGNNALGDGCTPGCRLERCGDGVLQPALDEACDDGNLVNQDGCSSLCQDEYCGDGVRQQRLGEDCDDGNLEAEDGCGPTCRNEVCGDGVLQSALGEECDDGNIAAHDGCGADCRIERCGDGVIQPGEQCDDGNTESGDSCGATCQWEPCATHTLVYSHIAGRGFGFELRDARGRLLFDHPNATFYPTAGVATLSAQIPAGAFGLTLRSNNDTGWFSGSLTVKAPDGRVLFSGTQAPGPTRVVNLAAGCVPFCGDGETQLGRGEQCDDGNAELNDTCQPNCRIPGCGDGYVTGQEACDDSNTTARDGCDANCQIEACATRRVVVRNTSSTDFLPAYWRLRDQGGAIVADSRSPEGFWLPLAPNTERTKVFTLGAGLYTFETLGFDQQPSAWPNGLFTFFEPDGSTLVFGSSETRILFQCRPICGDGVVSPEGGEECDDGNPTQDDGCTPTCKIERCGDGIVQTTRGERCDDGNTVDGDTCLGDCSALNCAPYVVRAEAPLRNFAGSSWSISTAQGYPLASFPTGLVGPGDVARVPVRLPPGVNRLTLQGSSLLFPLFVTVENGAGQRVLSASTWQATTVTIPFLTTCVPETCGNGVADAGEECDDRNREPDDGCSPGCTLERCGDGHLTHEEVCDDGALVGGDGCDPLCALEACTRRTLSITNEFGPAFIARWRIYREPAGDIVQQVDLGPILQTGQTATVPLDLLPGRYRFEPRVLSDFGGVEPGAWGGRYEVRDAGGAVLAAGTRTTTFDAGCVSFCGDGVVTGDEQCDDGNDAANDGCGPTCRTERCGDGILHPGESCDDGATAGGDGCSPTCGFEPCANHQVEITTGLNGFMVSWAIVDEHARVWAEGNGYPSSSTRTQTVELPAGNYRYLARPYFGQLGYAVVRILRPDGSVARSLTVDPANPIANAFPFATACVPFCGDGRVSAELGEQCDDGGRAPGDGCGATCLVEACGDGIVQAEDGEECDDGGRVDEDGCDRSCKREFCGDGKVQAGLGETCEDGNTAAQDGCANCQLERCGDGIVQRLRGEACDDGNTQDDGPCSADCRAFTCAPLSVQLFGALRGSEVGFVILDSLGAVAARVAPGTFADGAIDLRSRVSIAAGAYRFVPLGANASSLSFGAYTLRDAAGNVLALGVLSSPPAGGHAFTFACAGAWCGDGRISGDESCDDGNFEDGDGCSRACVLERCGDGILQRALGEQCDDGNDDDDDGCTRACVAVCRPVAVEVQTTQGGERVAWTMTTADGIAVASRPAGTYPASGTTRTPVTLTTGTYRLEAPAASGINGTMKLSATPGQLSVWHVFVPGLAQPLAPTTFLVACASAWCGDGRVNGDESCDDGNEVSGDGCTAGCVLERCGDGVTQAARGEECDDGATLDGDGCSSTCRVERCGDGVTQAARGESCDDGNVRDGDGCDARCVIEACGNGIVQIGESCDDGNEVAGDGCFGCMVERCGDGVVQASLGEACDDANLSDGDGCDARCRLEVCGNGIWQIDERCDDGNLAGGDGCDSNCQPERCAKHRVRVATPGQSGGVIFSVVRNDGTIALRRGPGAAFPQAGEVVDLPPGSYSLELADAGLGWQGAVLTISGPTDATLVSTGKTSAVGTPQTIPLALGCEAWCGDGIEQADEGCDDGGTLSGDGCSATCVLERCGDGVLQPLLGERCDDGNVAGGDGCSATCTLEACGNGQVEAGEECDLGDTVGGDGCGPECRFEFCGDGIVQRDLGEACDVGDPDGDAGCLAGCAAAVCAPYTLEIRLSPHDNAAEANWTIRDALGVQIAGRARGHYTAAGPHVETLALTGEDLVASIEGPASLSLTLRDVDGDVVQELGAAVAAGATYRRALTTTCRSAWCGDGSTQAGETCDDGNRVSGDGCDATCTAEICGDGIVHRGLGERCDDGNLASDDDCAGCQVTCQPLKLTLTAGAGVGSLGWRVLDASGVASDEAAPVPLFSGSSLVGAPRVVGGIHEIELNMPFPNFWRAHAKIEDVTGRVLFDQAVASNTSSIRYRFQAECIKTWCGDGLVQAGAGEECDDGARADDDGCSATCKIERCGDGVVQASRGETCDDGNLTAGDGCGASCRLEGCGDGVLQAGRAEQCDDGNLVSGDGCDASCRTETCGDGIVQPGLGEDCDLARAGASDIPGDGCDGACRFEACTDYRVRVTRGPSSAPQWTLKDEAGQIILSDLDAGGLGQTVSRRLMPGTLTFTPYRTNIFAFDRFVLELVHAGSGQVVSKVELHGFIDQPRTLAATCITRYCGDGVIDPQRGEECDDGNLVSEDGCSRECREELCGDGVLQAGLGEVCDDGGDSPGDGCDIACGLEPCAAHTLRLITRSGAWMIGWRLVDGAGREVARSPVDGYANDTTIDIPLQLPAGTYRFEQTSLTQLGWNGARFVFIDRTGDTLVGGTLIAGATSASLFVTTGCVERWCGDGVIDADRGEACDDGNRVSQDGCSATCLVERCGDGVVQPARGEACDDGNGVSEDGCSAACAIERCGDGVTQALLGESCDDGNLTSQDGCSAQCQLERCGDGVVQAGLGEACDDGNIAPDDGCSPACVLETCTDYTVSFEASGGGQGYWEITRDAVKVAGAAGLEVLPATFSAVVRLLPASYRFRIAGANANQQGQVTYRVLDRAGAIVLEGAIPWGGARAHNFATGCITRWCGDGVTQPDLFEECDDQNRVSGDGCSANCIVERCGDLVVQAALGETCDDGNTVNEDGCSATCRVERCGDGVVQASRGETCDDGNTASQDGCSATCKTERCGDAIVQAALGEQCDDGNVASEDGCSATCQTERCGDTIVQAGLGESCDDGNTADDDGCSARCRTERCGDGVVQASRGESCDDGNATSQDGCSSGCVLERCGDGIVQAGLGEQCDVGDAVDGDGCDANCRVEICGNGLLQVGEGCDDGNVASGDGCDAQCVRELCGNGKVQSGEGCDDGNLVDGDGCDARCVRELCGNGKVQAGEGCDDGNITGGDGCDANCRVERCGNSIVQPPETCDDGNIVSGDGCDAQCIIEACGNGKVQVGEECDDHNLVAWDGCSPSCRREACAPTRLLTTTAATGSGLRWFVRRASGGQTLAVGTNFGPNASNTRWADLGAEALHIELETTNQDGLGWNGATLTLLDWDGETLWTGILPAGQTRRVVTYAPTCIARWCGDRIVQAELGEACDDGWFTLGDGCDDGCQREFCGDGRVQVGLGEQCDDGNTLGGDGCDASCYREVCGNYRVQPPETCDDGNTRSGDGCDAQCVTEACGNGKVQGQEQCDDGNLVNGDGCDASCRHEVCGNGIVQSGEDCDDGNTRDGDRCDSACRVELCGNGRVQVGEQCDDGNQRNGDGCDGLCRLESCGNGFLQAGEQCDDGGRQDGDGCDVNCLREVCGNGVVQVGEQCDDGNRDNGDGCDSGCRREVCGNGIQQLGEDCDDGNVLSGDGCSATCRVERCGDGIRQVGRGEQCDDGNIVNGDGCDATCRTEVCGNGFLQVNEGCDDGNLATGDGCDGQCVREVCGNGKRQVGEACDNGAANSDTRADACRTNCQLARCGDGVRDSGEACDAGAGNGFASGACRPGCVLPRCGDGVVDPGEGCDDGGLVDGDGCSRVCVVEGCGDGVRQPSEECEDNNVVNGDGCDAGCYLERCGNGRLQVGEQCDDNNTATGDGCDAQCKLERCGNGIVQVGEQCDDGNTASGDGCDASCRTERCGDGVVQAARGETCDDGGTSGGDGCSSQCAIEDCARFSVRVITTSQGTISGWQVKRVGGAVVAEAPMYTLSANATTTTPVVLLAGEYEAVATIASWASAIGWDGGRMEVLDPSGGVVATATVPRGQASAVVRFSARCGVGCGDGIVQTSRGEECDDGGLVSVDGCDASCRVETCGRYQLSLSLPYGAGFSLGRVGQPPLVEKRAYAQGSPGTHTIPVTLLDGSWRVAMSAAGGLGWVGGGFSVTDAWGGVVASGTLLDGATNGVVDFSVTCGTKGCGDGVIQPDFGELCDDGNLVGNDGCDDDCLREYCGDHVVQTGLGEACDDGGTENGDGCDSRCRIEGCGNGRRDPGESCDDGNAAAGDGCLGCAWEPCSSYRLVIERPPLARMSWRLVDGQGNIASESAMGAGLPTVEIAVRLLDGAHRMIARAEAGQGGALPRWRLIAPWGAVVAESVVNTVESTVNVSTACRGFCGDGVVGAGEGCDDGGQTSGDGCSSTCVVERCGDGILHAGLGESCDDGGVVAGDGCSPGCAFEGCAATRVRVVTGDYSHTIGWELIGAGGVVVASAPIGTLTAWNTAFDRTLSLLPGAYTLRTLASNERGGGWQGATFEVRSLLMNDVRAAGTMASGSAAARGFTIECGVPACGDDRTQTQVGEQCDDGGRVSGDACSGTCQFEACATHTVKLVVAARSPGFDIVDPRGEVVVSRPPGTYPPSNPPVTFTETVQLVAGQHQIRMREKDNVGWGTGSISLLARDGSVLASGTLAVGATGQQARLVATTGCVTEWCGDGVVQTSRGELCDDGNRVSGDGCSATCGLEVCGDGILQAALGETCDDGNRVDGDGCTNACTVARCGDGVVRVGVEACDDGNQDNGDTCTNSCTAARCGDGFPQVSNGEQCDDGNLDDTDACTRSCRLPRCGDGALQTGSGEACEDGGVAAADGCSPTCAFESCATHTVRFHLGHDRWRAGYQLLDASGRVLVEVPLGDYQYGVIEKSVNLIDGNFKLRTLARSGSTQAWQFFTDPLFAYASTHVDVIDHEGGRLIRAIHGGGVSQDHTFVATCVNRCGDGILHALRGEACDDGNLADEDGCSATCLVERCGDGVVQRLRGETCDDGNLVTGDGCDASCKVEGCGDGILQAQLGEECDDGNVLADDGCGPTCRTERCGDGVVQVPRGEECDAGQANANVANQCRTNCKRAACGDGIVDAGEACDWGVYNSDTQANACRKSCAVARCGDGVRDAGEQCDDRNNVGGDGCSATCAREVMAPVCGNGVREGNEECDDGARVGGDGCSAACLHEGCGDGVVGGHETCDDGGRASGDGCDAQCQREVCGNGIVQAGEACDDGNFTAGDGCDAGCVLEVCGNGVKQAGEQCDDGNQVFGDGCTPACQFEDLCKRYVLRWWSNPVYFPPDSVRVVASDGTVIATNQGIGWDRTSGVGEEIPLRLEPTASYTITMGFLGRSAGFSYTLVHAASGQVVAQGGWATNAQATPLALVPRCVTAWCGDGAIQASLGEQCDDGGQVGGDGCSASCRNEGCGDGVFQPLLGEQCEDHNRLAGDGCDGACRFEATCARHILRIERGLSGDGTSALRWTLVGPDGAVVATEADAVRVDQRVSTVAVNLLPGMSYAVVPQSGTYVAAWNDFTATLVHAGSGDVVASGSLGAGMTTGKRIALSFTSCITSWCGDGVKGANEGCDDGNRVGFDGCGPSCELERCGDGIVHANLGESCDDGNQSLGDACRPDCQWGLCSAFELRWNRPTVSGPNKRIPPTKIFDAAGGLVASFSGEDGPIPLRLGTGNYRIETTMVTQTELSVVTQGSQLPMVQLDSGMGFGVVSRTFEARCVAPFCGDGIVQSAAGEACDDGNRSSFDGCTATCLVERCGDGVVQFELGEVCDDGNDDDNDFCRNGCRESRCGMLRLEIEYLRTFAQFEVRNDRGRLIRTLPETPLETYTTHEVALSLPPGRYTLKPLDQGSTSFTLRDGMGAVLAAFTWRNGGSWTGYDGFAGNFVFEIGCTGRCGDLATQPWLGESCDDGNGLSNDGCGATCVSEGWRCGDGVAQPTIGESCDDGNTTAGDGCGATCQREYCGDGVRQATLGEECDDGNINDNDNCHNDCTVNLCGNGVVDTAAGEECDIGIATDAPGCTVRCRWAPCTKHTIHTDYSNLFSALQAIPGAGAVASLALAAVNLGLMQTLVWEIWDETRQRFVVIPRPTVYPEGPGITRWPGYGVTLPGSQPEEIWNMALDFVLQAALRAMNPIKFNPEPVRWVHLGVILPPGQYRWRQLVTLPGPWLMTIQYARSTTGRTVWTAPDIASTVTPGWQESAMTVTCDWRCGDGVVQRNFGEQCDDGNLADGDGCDSECRWEWLPMRRIPGGAYLAGTPGNERFRDGDEALHPVVVGDFEIGIFEVKIGEYKHYMNGADPSGIAYSRGGGDCETQCSATGVYFHEAALFANRVSAERGLEACYACNGTACVPTKPPRECQGYRLPTEAEWEYAARGLGRDRGMGRPSEMATRDGAPTLNTIGLRGMLGSAPEWVHDFYGGYPEVVNGRVPDLLANPSGPPTSDHRVSRGGGFDMQVTTNVEELREIRNGARKPRSPAALTTPEGWKIGIGFRLARTR